MIETENRCLSRTVIRGGCAGNSAAQVPDRTERCPTWMMYGMPQVVTWDAGRGSPAAPLATSKSDRADKAATAPRRVALGMQDRLADLDRLATAGRRPGPGLRIAVGHGDTEYPGKV